MVTVHGNRKLAPLIVTIFFYFAAVGCLVPFLSTHMRDLGLTPWEIVIINTATAFISILGPPIFGVVAEKWHKHRFLLVITLLLAGSAYTGLLFIPRIIRTPRTPIMEFDCDLGVRIEKCDNWATCDDGNKLTSNSTTFRLHGCNYACPYHLTQVNASYPLHFCFLGNRGNICIVYDTEIEENGTLKFNTRFQSWFPEPWGIESSSNFMVMDPAVSVPKMEVCLFRPTRPIYVNDKIYDDIQCRPPVTNCSVKCFLQIVQENGDSEALPCQEVIGNPELTFWSYLGVRSVGDMALLTALCLIDAVTVTSINEFEGAYGKTRVWAALGLSVFPPISGVLVDYYSGIANRPDYSPAVFNFDGLILITCALVIALPIGRARGSKYQNGIYYARQPKMCSGELAVLFTNLIILGIQWGYMETFLHLFYVDIDCTKLIIGITFTVAFVCSIPFLCISKNMVRNIGKSNLLVFAFLFYGIRYAGTSFITFPWWSLPFEAMETFSLSVMWIATVAYGHHLMPQGSHLTIHYAVYMLHFGVGRGLGTIFGGLLNDAVGTRITMRGIAIFSTAYGLVYLFIHHIYIRPRQKLKKMPQPAVILNGAWYSMAEGRANGDTHAHQPIIGDQDDMVDGPSASVMPCSK